MQTRFFSFVVLVALTGCSTLPPVPSANAPVQQCMVCRHQRDLSCLEVERKPGTPQAAHAGRTYYFCSGSCCDEFQRNPKRYAAKGR